MLLKIGIDLRKQLFNSIEQEVEIKDILKIMKETEQNIIDAVKKYKVKL